MEKNPIKPYELDVAEIFRFGDGSTIFVGPLSTELKIITPCRVEVLLDGNHLTDVDLVGERSPGPKVPPGYRIVYTNAPITIDASIAPSRIKLVHREQAQA